MKSKVIVLALIGGLALLVVGMAVGFWAMQQFSSDSTAYSGQQPGYGRGMMGGYDSSGTPAPQGSGRGMMGGRGMTGGNGAPPAPADPSIKPVQMTSSTASQKVGGMNVALELNPFPPASFQQASFNVKLTDDKGQAINDAKISLDLTMPGMWMPPSKPDAQALSDGAYRANARFTMRGWWRIEVIITRGAEKQSAFFDVAL
jgi:hypothetical protein